MQDLYNEAYEAGQADALKSKEVRAMLAALEDAERYFSAETYGTEEELASVRTAIAAAKAAGIGE